MPRYDIAGLRQALRTKQGTSLEVTLSTCAREWEQLLTSGLYINTFEAHTTNATKRGLKEYKLVTRGEDYYNQDDRLRRADGFSMDRVAEGFMLMISVMVEEDILRAVAKPSAPSDTPDLDTSDFYGTTNNPIRVSPHLVLLRGPRLSDCADVHQFDMLLALSMGEHDNMKLWPEDAPCPTP